MYFYCYTECITEGNIIPLQKQQQQQKLQQI